MGEFAAIVLAVVALVAGGVAVLVPVAIASGWPLRRALRRAPRHALGDLGVRPAPRCRTSGTLMPGPDGAVVAPASQETVAAYWTTVTHRYADAGESTYAQEVVWQRRTTGLLRLVDGTASALLEVDHAFPRPPSTTAALPDHDARTTVVHEQSDAGRGAAPEWAGPALRGLLDRGLIPLDSVTSDRRHSRYIVVEDVVRPGVAVHLLVEPVPTSTSVLLRRPGGGDRSLWALPADEVDRYHRPRARDWALPAGAAVVALIAAFLAVQLW
jgi:hypothetical protein